MEAPVQRCRNSRAIGGGGAVTLLSLPLSPAFLNQPCPRRLAPGFEKKACAFVPNPFFFTIILLIRTPGMNRFLLNTARTIFILALLQAHSRAGESSAETPVFKDKNLEKAVRKFVFAKRDNDKPVLEADVVNLSTIQGVGMEVTDLSGLEKCVNLASLDLAKNKIKDLTPLKGLSKLQFLNLADNQVENIAPLAEDNALQYVELSNNHVNDLNPLSALTNLASLYLANNQITDI